MLTARIKIAKIDYNSTFHNFFPKIMEMLSENKKGSLGVKLLLKLGETSETAVIGILDRLDEIKKQEIICGVVARFSADIVRKLNEKLSEHEIGQCITVGSILAQRKSDGLWLTAENISVNYNRLASNQTVKDKINQTVSSAAEKKAGLLGGAAKAIVGNNADKLVRTVAVIAPNKAESTVLKYLNDEKNKQFILSAAEKALVEKGVIAEIADINISSAEDIIESVSDNNIVISDRENDIIDAVAAYLKELIEN